jgi:glycosyltransferase involved in cell wall biosynthesis
MTQVEVAQPRPPGRPLASVLVVNYNYERFLPEAIHSVLEQTYDNYEIVICDDGSTDGSRDVIESFRARLPERVVPVLKENGGVGSALNAAFDASRGDVICLLDADDRFFPTKIARVVDAFRADPRAVMVVNRMVKVDSEGEVSGLIPQVGELDSGWIRDDMLASGGHWSFAPASGISLTRSCAQRIFPIPELFRTEADAYLFTQAPLWGGVNAISEPLSYYRLHASNVTSVQHIDFRYADRIVKGIERMMSALQESARARNLRVPQITDNPTYAEMTLLRDFYAKGPTSVLLRDLRLFWRSAYRCRSADRLRWRLKPLVLSALLLLPRSYADKLVQALYLPTPARDLYARWRIWRRSRRLGDSSP